MLAILGGIGSLLLAVFGFLVGRATSQSEAILAEKRRVYEEVLRLCPHANQLYQTSFPEEDFARLIELTGVLSFYASPRVSQAFSLYLDEFSDTFPSLSPTSPAPDPGFVRVARRYNDLVLEMRRDALAWSVFGYRGPSRLPPLAAANTEPNERQL